MIKTMVSCNSSHKPIQDEFPQGCRLVLGSAEETFNFAQMLQGENVPASVAQLQEKIRQHGHWAAKSPTERIGTWEKNIGK